LSVYNLLANSRAHEQFAAHSPGGGLHSRCGHACVHVVPPPQSGVSLLPLLYAQNPPSLSTQSYTHQHIHSYYRASCGPKMQSCLREVMRASDSPSEIRATVRGRFVPGLVDTSCLIVTWVILLRLTNFGFAVSYHCTGAYF